MQKLFDYVHVFAVRAYAARMGLTTHDVLLIYIMSLAV